jgi:predicted amidohydrolase
MLRIAVAQTPGNRLDQWPKVLELAEELVQRSANRNADLVLLPECFWPAYFIGSVDEYFQARDAGMPTDRWFLAQLANWSSAHRIAICVGHVAELERRLYNAATLIDAGGQVLGTYHKCFLWDWDHEFFEPGNSPVTLKTEWGRVGLMICADARLPEIPATLAARGAQLILQPTAWVNVGTPERLWNPQPELLVPERAREFGLPIASASKWGVEGDTTFVGSSIICDAAGNVLAQCGTSETNVIEADIELTTPRKPEMTPTQRARLLAREPATLPAATVPRLRVVLLRALSDAPIAVAELREAHPGESTAPILLLTPSPSARSSEAHVERGDNWLCLSGPTEGAHDVGGVRVAAVRDHNIAGFAPIRTLALAGVHLVVVFGDSVSERTLRSRAAENRVFVIHATESGIKGYDPLGHAAGTSEPYTGPRSARGDEIPVLELDVEQAADKEFAPRTNPFAARTPELYAL